MFRLKKLSLILLGTGFFGLGAAEVGLRALGVIDFPIYNVDPEIGYIPAPNQSGTFLNKNAWVLNDKSMGVAENWKPNGDKDLLLIGDSIVWGGNPVNQPDKLGPQLQRLRGWAT